MLLKRIYIIGLLLLALGVSTFYYIAKQQQEQETFIVGNPLLVSY